MNLKSFAIVLGTISSVVGATEARAADAARIRGTVVSVAGSTLTVEDRDGKTDAITLAGGWKISGVAKASATDIKHGDFLGIASVSKADGGSGALEVVIFPAALKGTGEGDRDWDLRPNSRMTNGTVADVTEIQGRTVTLTYDNGQKKQIAIPQATPIVTFATATPADLAPVWRYSSTPNAAATASSSRTGWWSGITASRRPCEAGRPHAKDCRGPASPSEFFCFSIR